MTARIARLYAAQAYRAVAARGYAASASKPALTQETDIDVEPQAESSSAAQRRSNANALEGAAEKPRRRRGPNALSLLRAQKLARAMQESAPPSAADIPSTSPVTNTATGTEVKAEPTLEDLEAKRPARPPPPLDSRRYPKFYKNLYDGIDEAFVAKQILKLAGQLGVRPPRGRGKGLAIEGILKTWGWPPPLPPQQPKLRQVTMEREWTLGKAQLWLLFQSRSSDVEGEGILDQGVTFSVQPSQAGGREGTVLKGTGTAQALETLDDLIIDRLAAIEQCTRTVTVAHEVSLLGVVSSASGAYIEPAGEGQLRISAGSETAAEKAISLLTQAEQHASIRQESAGAIVIPSTGQYMALYPHLPSPTGSVPWQELSRAVKPLFRLRGVQPWETKVGPRETGHMAEKMDQAPGHLFGSGTDAQEGTTLEELITSASRTDDPASTVTTVRFGHLVYPDDRPTTPTSTLSLSPPLIVRLTLADVPTAQALSVRPVFLPSLPPALIHFPLTRDLRAERRLRYRAGDGRILEVVNAAPVDESPSSAAPPPPVQEQQESGWKGELDDMLARLDVGEHAANENPDTTTASSTTPPENQGPLVKARVITENSINISMPDRPIDAHVIATTSATIIPDVPGSITSYLTGVGAGTQPPASLDIEGAQWELVSALELDMIESNLSGPTPHLNPDLGLSPPTERILLRTVKATDLTFGSGRTLRYAELETQGSPSPVFWTELAKVTRVLAPGAGALRTEIF